MRMANDTVEGEQAEILKDAQRAFRDLTKNIQQVRLHFGFQEALAPTGVVQVPVEFSSEVGLLVKAYLEVASALSGDDLTKAQAGLSNLLSVLR